MSKILDSKGFDGWSKSYDESIKQQEQYPFAGYDEIVLEVVNQTVGPNILDIGIGSGNISKHLYDLGYKVTG